MNDIILVGGFAETIELCELCGYRIIGILDNVITGSISGYPILGNDENAEHLYNDYKNTPIIISPDKPQVRKKLFKLYRDIGYKITSLISPKAFIAPTATIGCGCIIQSFCNISTGSVLGDGVKVNTYANIMHDANIENYVTIAPNAVLLGYVNVEEAAYIGANSTIIQTHKIGQRAIVGAGAVVTHDVSPDTTVIGVPARVMKENDNEIKK